MGKRVAKRKRPAPASRYKGLAWDKHEMCWRVRVSLMGKQHHLGRHNDELFAAQVYDCAALLLFGEAGAVNFGAEQAKQWLPRLLSEDCPGLRAIQELGRRSRKRPAPPRTPGEDGDDAGGGDDYGYDDGGGEGGGGGDGSATGGEEEDSDDDDTGAGRDGGAAHAPGLAFGPGGAPCQAAKRARTAAAAAAGIAHTTPLGGPTGGYRLLAGLHSLTAGGMMAGGCAGLPLPDPLEALSPRLRAAGAAAGAGAGPAGLSPRWLLQLPPLAPQPPRDDNNSGDSSGSPTAVYCSAMQVPPPPLLPFRRVATVPAAGPAPPRCPQLQLLGGPGGPHMVPVQPADRASTALLADCQDILARLPGPPLFQPQRPFAPPLVAPLAAALAAAQRREDAAGCCAAPPAPSPASGSGMRGLPPLPSALATLGAGSAGAADGRALLQPLPVFGIGGGGAAYAAAAAGADEWGAAAAAALGGPHICPMGEHCELNGGTAPCHAAVMDIYNEWRT
ncbi:hypothetical protein Rsub_12243 [Raphidocelis subcapitata]|uniref:AP2/ERF domain-containing protein n=1 Tax=Raphidocelis subcapitata TaxID=307507 RepID=A0A2V0PHX3_9CHLO|nr:hypothetical protein Rsub_12243 [Raphidocelis subcapitata]|eukprot:GBF99411.1 hypothetical protein Rsub_12243 [Raphidocelis subcapitata]